MSLIFFVGAKTCPWITECLTGSGRGTKFTLDYAKEKNKPIKINDSGTCPHG